MALLQLVRVVEEGEEEAVEPRQQPVVLEPREVVEGLQQEW